MLRTGVLGAMGLLLAGCMAEAPAMKACLAQFTEAECACLKKAIPDKKWRTIDLLAQNTRLVSRRRAIALSLRENAEDKCGPLTPRPDALPF